MRLCDRNFGIGADGVIFALPGINGTDYTMRIFNSDGSEPEVVCFSYLSVSVLLQFSHVLKIDDSIYTVLNIPSNRSLHRILSSDSIVQRNAILYNDLTDKTHIFFQIECLLKCLIDSEMELKKEC